MAMKKNRLTLIIAANLAVLAVLVFALPQLMVSPGQPIEAHADLAEDCFGCHTPFLGSTADKCIACHRVEKIGRFTTTGVAIDQEDKQVAFHQQLIEEDCVACHSEHKGVKPFRPIGRFSHELLQVTTREQCNGCHSRPGDALHQKIENNCNECHTNEAWLPATFDHRDYFRFDRHHDTEFTWTATMQATPATAAMNTPAPRSAKSTWKRASMTMRTVQSAIAAAMKMKRNGSGNSVVTKPGAWILRLTSRCCNVIENATGNTRMTMTDQACTRHTVYQ